MLEAMWLVIGPQPVCKLINYLTASWKPIGNTIQILIRNVKKTKKMKLDLLHSFINILSNLSRGNGLGCRRRRHHPAGVGG